MSAKLLYTLSDDNAKNLQKQIGCMNGFLQFFDRHHFVNGRGVNSSNSRRLLPGESSHQGRDDNAASKRIKEKHRKVAKEKQRSVVEPSRPSISSSTCSSVEHETSLTETNSWDCRVNRSHTSPCRSNASPVRATKREHLDSPRPSLQPFKLDSPRLSSLNESFRSISSHSSAPITTSRMSYDGTETRDASFVSSFKVRDLPRLSLDSRQRTINSTRKTQNPPEEPGSYRAPSSIVAKLMGLEDLPVCSSPTNRNLIDTNGPRICGRTDSTSRSSRSIDGSKPNRFFDSPRSSSGKDSSRTPRLNKVDSVSNPEEPQTKHSLTLYGEIEKRLADLDFKKSGTDLRALKQILQAIQREEKTVQETKKVNQSLQVTQTNWKNQEATTFPVPQTSKKSTREIKPARVVKGSRKEVVPVTHDVPLPRLRRLRLGQPVDTVQRSVEKKKTPRPIKTPNAPKCVTNKNYCHSSATTRGAKTKQNNQHIMGLHYENERIQQKSSILQDNNEQSSNLSNDAACLIQQGNANSFQGYSGIGFDTLQKINRKNPGLPNDESFKDIGVIKEQPSPVSVLDANLFGDESPSPVKKKPTAFRDDGTSTPTGAEWKDMDLYDSPYRIRQSFIIDIEYQEPESVKHSPHTLWLLNSYEAGTAESAKPLHKEENLEKAYVAEILLAAGSLDDLHFSDASRVQQSKEVINPNLYFLLEQTKGNTSRRANDKHRRRLIFDVVNEILSEKLSLNTVHRVRTGQHHLLQDILKEIDLLQANNFHQSLDDEDDFLTTIIGNDLTHSSANWINASSETPGLVLDIERLIFKDLIGELVCDESAYLQAQKRRLSNNLSN